MITLNTLYTILVYLALPFIMLRLWWRGRRSPGYRQRIPERLGYYSSTPKHSTIWLHAVSYGESVAAEPIINELLKRYPDSPMLVTSMTPTGAARIAQRYGDQVIHQYIPYDFPGATERFYQHNQPRIAIIMETELWPNLLNTCTRHQVPLLLANARLSERSYQSYYRFQQFTQKMLRQFNVIAAQSDEDASRFQQLGALPQQLTMSGNIKFDVPPRPDLWQAGLQWRAQIGDRPVWMAASTHAGEEEQVLAAHQIILKQFPNALLILAPRHTDRVDRVTQVCESLHFTVERYTVQEFPKPTTQIFIVDVMGQLPKFYRASEVAFVGGSLMPIGGHNFIEAASASAPIILGPHLFNFTAIAEKFKQAQACVMINNSAELAQKVLALLASPEQRKALTQAADVLVEKNTGALEKLLQHVARLLSL